MLLGRGFDFRIKEGLIPAFSKVGYSPSTSHRNIEIYVTRLIIGV
jgi:hypothetical protein